MRRGAGGSTDTGLGRDGSQDGCQKRRCALFLISFYQFFDSQCTAPHPLKLFPPSQSVPTNQLRKTAPLALPTGNSARKSVPSASPARNSARKTAPSASPTDNLAGAEFLTVALLAHTSSSKLPVFLSAGFAACFRSSKVVSELFHVPSHCAREATMIPLAQDNFFERMRRSPYAVGQNLSRTGL
jgi:hypothetical protein